MQAVILTAHGGPDCLVVRDDRAIPSAGPGQVRVAVSASSVNNTDIWTREGAYGAPGNPTAIVGWRGVPIRFPRIQGIDAVGHIDSVGSGVDGSLLERRVLVDPAIRENPEQPDEVTGVLGSEIDGAFAEYLVVDAGSVHDVSQSPLTDAQLACLPTAYGTAMGMLDRAEVSRGEIVVVTGASGGVGMAAVQLAAALGAVVCAVSTPQHEEDLRRSGASFVLDRGGDIAEQLRSVQPSGVNVVVDVVGGEMFELWPSMLKVDGCIVVAGAVAGPVVSVDLRQLYLAQRRIVGSTLHTRRQFERLVDLANTGTVDPVIAARFPLADVREAQRYFLDKSETGKVILDVGRES